MMCKSKVVMFVMTIAFCFMFSGSVYAFSIYTTLQIDNPNYYSFFYEGYTSLLDELDENVKPIIHNGSTFLPVRATFRAVNFGDGSQYTDIDWNTSEKKATILYKDQAREGFSQKIAEFWIDKPTAVYYDENGENGRNVTLSNPPIIIGGRTYLPLRAVIDAFEDLEIVWIPSNRGIVLYPVYTRPDSVVFPDGSSASL